MIRASKGYSETMRKQNESGASRARNKEQETNSDNKQLTKSYNNSILLSL